MLGTLGFKVYGCWGLLGFRFRVVGDFWVLGWALSGVGFTGLVECAGFALLPAILRGRLP